MRRLLLLCALLLVSPALHAQDSLNLPTELYVLRNEGIIERYGLGVEGVSVISDEDEFILDFSIAPDGNWMAYRTLEGLFLSNLYDERERQIEGEDAGLPDIRGRGSTMAWSPRSDALAYTTSDGARVHFFLSESFSKIEDPNLFNLVWSPDGRFLAAETDDGVWWIYQMRDGQAALTSAIPDTVGLTWVNPTQLLFAPFAGGLVLMDLANGNQQTPILDAEQRYYLPQRLQDDRVHVLVGEPNAARLQEIRFLGDTTQVEDVGVSFVDPSNVRWSPDGNLLVVFQGGVLALIDPISGNGFTLPIGSASAYSWGPSYPPALSAPLPTSATLLAADTQGIVQVWRLPEDGSDPQQLTVANQSIIDYALAPDRSSVAYVSNSGLWVAPLEDAGVEVRSLGISSGIAPQWSTDGLLIYYRDEQPSGNGIWRYEVMTGEASLIIPDGDAAKALRADPSSAVAALLIEREDSLHVFDTAADDLYSLGLAGSGFWLDNTELLALGTWGEIRGLYRFDANVPDEPINLILPLSDNLALLDYQRINQNTVRALVQATNPGEIRVTDIPIAGGPPQIIANAGYMTAPRLAPNGSRVVGTTRPNGSLLVYNVNSNSHYSIEDLSQVSTIRWQSD